MSPNATRLFGAPKVRLAAFCPPKVELDTGGLKGPLPVEVPNTGVERFSVPNMELLLPKAGLFCDPKAEGAVLVGPNVGTVTLLETFVEPKVVVALLETFVPPNTGVVVVVVACDPNNDPVLFPNTSVALLKFAAGDLACPKMLPAGRKVDAEVVEVTGVVEFALENKLPLAPITPGADVIGIEPNIGVEVVADIPKDDPPAVFEKTVAEVVDFDPAKVVAAFEPKPGATTLFGGTVAKEAAVVLTVEGATTAG